MKEENNLDFLDTEAPKEITFYVAGVQFRKGWRENLVNLEKGGELQLTPEPTNKYDPNAVMISTLHAVSGETETFLGYVPAKGGLAAKNIWVLNRLFEGQKLKAIALEINSELEPWQALLVKVEIIA